MIGRDPGAREVCRLGAEIDRSTYRSLGPPLVARATSSWAASFVGRPE